MQGQQLKSLINLMRVKSFEVVITYYTRFVCNIDFRRYSLSSLCYEP
jgi:hypothetical protein